MGRLAVCVDCGRSIQPEEEKFKHKAKTYCKECHEKIQRDADEYRQLMTYICENYHMKRPSAFVLKQVKSFRIEYDYSYGAMTYTLWYCHEVLGKAFDEKYGIALVKYYYDEAKEYYSQQEKLKRQIDNISKVEVKTKVVKQTSVNSNKNKASLIDFGDLLKGGGSN